MNRERNDPFGIISGSATGNPPVDLSTDEETILVGDLQKKIDDFKQTHTGWLNNCEYLRLMLKGDQLVVRRRTDKTVLRIISSESEDVRRRHSRDNVMHVAARAFVGKFCRVIPSVMVWPASNDRMDLKAAEVRESFLDYVWRKERMKLKWKRAGEALPWCGTAIFQPVWDANSGPTVSVCPSCEYVGKENEVNKPCPVCAAQAQMEAMDAAMQEQSQAIAQGIPPQPAQPPDMSQVPILLEGSEGDLKVLIHDARDFIFDTSVDEIEDMTWCGIQSVLHISKIRKMFPDKWEQIQAEEGLYSDRYLHYSGSLDTTVLRNAWLEDHARLYEIHEMPTGEFPQGRVIYLCNNRLLKVVPNDYVNLLGRLPFYAIRGDRRADEFLGEPLAIQAEDLQKERNKLADTVRESRELTASPKVISAFNSGVNQETFTTTPGEHIKYNPLGGKPEYMRPPDLPNYTWNELERLSSAIREKFLVTEHDLGNSSGDQSGRFAAFLETQSTAAMSPILIECFEEWVELHRAILLIGKEFMSADRQWVIQGQGRVQTFSWEGADDRYGWDVGLATEDSLSKNPTLRLQQAERLLQDGIFADPTTGGINIKAFARMAGLKLPDLGPDMQGTEHAYASELPKLIEKALERGQNPFQVVPIQLFDDPQIMVEELLGWLLENRGNQNKQLVQIVIQYWYQYMQVLSPQDPRNALMLQRVQGMSMIANPQAQMQRPQPPQGVGPGGNQMAAGETPASTMPQQQALIQAADKRAEAVARPAGKQEGSTL